MRELPSFTRIYIVGLAPDSEGTETPQPKLTDSDIRAIIGGVVGGVVALSIAILTVVACTYCIRRKKKKGASQTFRYSAITIYLTCHISRIKARTSISILHVSGPPTSESKRESYTH